MGQIKRANEKSHSRIEPIAPLLSHCQVSIQNKVLKAVKKDYGHSKCKVAHYVQRSQHQHELRLSSPIGTHEDINIKHNQQPRRHAHGPAGSVFNLFVFGFVSTQHDVTKRCHLN